ncbi:MAG: hypothetical protein NZ903_01290 [Candidatus Micrarchaeota archaeon]|nr:hypothetical protein [Candidatus Micrarchaeota archaeon]
MKIKEGKIHVYYIFDIASEILLEKLEKVFGKKPVESQIQFTRLTPRYVQYTQPPYLITIGEKQIELSKDNKLQFKITAKLYDFGVVSLRFSTPFAGDLDQLAVLSSELVDNAALEKEAYKQLERIRKEIAEVLVKPLDSPHFEDYIIFVAKELDKKVSVNEIANQYGNKIAAVLRAETENLGESQIRDTLKTSISYFEDDVVFVDWNAAFIFDPRDSFDTLEVLEYANIELLELRTYDDILDKEIDKAYEDLSPANSPLTLIALDPFSKTLNRLEEVKLDVTQVIEKVENALKLVGDPYLAKVYSAASDSFKLMKWKESVREKLEIIEGFYNTTVNRIQNVRMLVLEAMIVLLFIVDIIIYLTE